MRYDKDPTFPKNETGAAMLTFDMTKRAFHPFAEQFNYFQDANECKFGYQIESYPKALSSLTALFKSSIYGL